MPTISLDMPVKMYNKVEKIALNRTLKESRFVSMNEVLLPILEKEFN